MPPGAFHQDLAYVIGWSSTRYVLLHRSMMTAEQAARLEAFLEQQPGLEGRGVEHDLVVFRGDGRGGRGGSLAPGGIDPLTPAVQTSGGPAAA